jgi:hypothetical protein
VHRVHRTAERITQCRAGDAAEGHESDRGGSQVLGATVEVGVECQLRMPIAACHTISSRRCAKLNGGA